MEKIDKIENFLNKLYKNPKCELNFENSLQLLVAVILSAQCTDKRVNKVTKILFEKYKTAQDFASADKTELEKEIFECGFYKNKSKFIIESCQKICSQFNGEIPNTLEDLQTLCGVGRKTANVVFSTILGGDAFAVDTHVLRISNRLGLCKTQNAYLCEKSLMKKFPKGKWSKLHQQMVHFGRYFCKAKKPNCNECELKEICVCHKKEIKCS